jgi:hypothetical protein
MKSWSAVGTLMRLEILCLALLFVASLPSEAQQAPSLLTVTDVSPDAPYGTPQDSNGQDPSGRIKSLIIDPTNDSILYAASFYSGVWKSKDGGQTWNQASSGLRSGFSVAGDGTNNGGPALAIDATNPQRLVYLTSEDGRPGVPCAGDPPLSQACTLAGVWVSVDGAASWQHVDLPGCPRPAVVGAVFAGGAPFLLTNSTSCRLWTSADYFLQIWVPLSDPPFPGSEEIMVAANSSSTLFVCQGDKVYRWPAQSFTPWPDVQYIGGPCRGLAVVPPQPGSFPSTLVAMYDAFLDNAIVGRDVCIVSFDTGSPFTCNNSGLHFILFASLAGSGVTGVYVAPIVGGAYDIFAADGFDFYRYQGGSSWAKLQGMHADTHGMAFPSTYNPLLGNCTSYAATDGGVFINNNSGPFGLNCDPSTEWVHASSGLHVYASEAMAGLSQTHDACPNSLLACPILYDPAADDEVWVSAQGGVPGSSWKDLQAETGDAGQVFIDPAQPYMVVSGRFGGCAITFQFNKVGTEPVTPDNATPARCIAPSNFAGGTQTPHLGGFSVVMTLPTEAPYAFGDYLAYESVYALHHNQCPAGGSSCDDLIVRNTAAPLQTNPNDFWTDISPSSHFGTGTRGHIGAIATSGGHHSLVVYVLTSNASNGPNQARQVWRGQTDSSGFVPSWSAASGDATHPLVRAYNLIANPYDPNEVYASDLGDNTIKISRDGGATWDPVPVLKDIATNYGEFTFGCGDFASGSAGGGIFQAACPLVDVAFNREHPEIRVAALFPGGIAFSRDYGRHWISLNVTNTQPFPLGKFAQGFDLIEMPRAVFFDPQLNPFTGSPSIFVGIQGQGVMRVDGPFPTLVSGRIFYCPACENLVATLSSQIVAFVPGLGVTVPLRPQSDGLFRGDFPFDSAKNTSFSYYFTVDGNQTQTFTKTLSAGEIATGVALVSNAGTPVVAGKIVDHGASSPGVVGVDLQLTDTGTGIAQNIDIAQLLFRTLHGRGTVTYNATLSGALPVSTGLLGVGQNTSIRLYLNVPRTVSRFSIIESGTVQDGIGTNYNFSIEQAVRCDRRSGGASRRHRGEIRRGDCRYGGGSHG